MRGSLLVGDRAAVTAENLDRLLSGGNGQPPRLGDDDPLGGSSLSAAAARRLFEDQVRSRELDHLARRLRSEGRGFYTIASAGHEDNVTLGALLRPTDPCFLHYRSGAVMMARGRHAEDDPVRSTVLSLMAAADDPVAGGRHKVWGSPTTWVPPQTSTIGSHVPKAVGTAFAHTRASRVNVPAALPEDAIVCCSFGDASANHATTLAGINAARYAHRRGSPVPILFVCEDNGLGISVRTPRRWIEDTYGSLSRLAYIPAAGHIDEVWEAVSAAVDRCRTSRAPTFLHLETVRLWGHAGSDVESAYRTSDEIEADEQRDPLLRTARRLLDIGAATHAGLRELVSGVREEVRRAAEDLADSPPLPTREEVVAPLAPAHPDRWEAAATGTVEEQARQEHFGRTLPEEHTADARRTLAAHLNATLHDEMLRRPNMLVFGEDVAVKGGVYGVTGGLEQAFGTDRVFDTLLDETTVLGTAQGAGLLGLLPVPEIQYLAYVHNALDQIRGEAASLQFFSAGRFTNPMVVRIASFAYQKGFGGHFHNDNSVGALRDIPGLVIAAPARGDDAARMLRTALAMAAEDGRVVAFLEPIALYHERDLHEPGDGGWLTDYPPPGSCLLPGDVGRYGPEDADALIVTYANGLRMSLRAQRRLAEHGITTRVLDLRWLAPLPLDAVTEEARRIGPVLVADECRATAGGIADAVVAHLGEQGHEGSLASVRSADSYVPLGPAAARVLLQEEQIEDAVRDLLR